MVILPKAPRQENNVFIPLSVGKPSFVLMSQLGIHYLTIHTKCTAGWIPTTPKDFFQLYRLTASWECPLGQTMETESLFQRLFHREHLLMPTLVCPPNVWPGSRFPLSLTQYKKLYILFLRYIHQRFPCLPTGWNSSFSVYFCTAQALCKPQLPSICNITHFGPGNTKP